MWCYDCSVQAVRREAVGVCHHCSAGVCSQHGVMIAEAVWRHEPVVKVEAMPKNARELLCRTCHEALAQSSRPG